MKKLVLKNSFFVKSNSSDITIQSYFNDMMLHGQLSRSRSRFLELLRPRIIEIDDERLKLMEKYQVKDEKTGLPILFTVEGVETTDVKEGVKYKLLDKESFEKELSEYLEEAFVIDVTPSSRDTIYAVRDIILKSNDIFGGRNAMVFDEWCRAFENISNDKEEVNEVNTEK